MLEIIKFMKKNKFKETKHKWKEMNINKTYKIKKMNGFWNANYKMQDKYFF